MIKYISFDNSVVDAAVLEEKLRLVCCSVYKNGQDQFFVNYQGSCHSLYDNIAPIVGEKNILLLDLMRMIIGAIRTRLYGNGLNRTNNYSQPITNCGE